MDERSTVNNILGPALASMLYDLDITFSTASTGVLAIGKRGSVRIDKVNAGQASYWRVDGKPFYTRANIVFYCYAVIA